MLLTPMLQYVTYMLALNIFCKASVIINKDISRSIDATTAIVRVSTDIKISSSSTGKYDYEIIYPNNHAEHLSFLSVTVKGKGSPLAVSPPVM